MKAMVNRSLNFLRSSSTQKIGKDPSWRLAKRPLKNKAPTPTTYSSSVSSSVRTPVLTEGEYKNHETCGRDTFCKTASITLYNIPRRLKHISACVPETQPCSWRGISSTSGGWRILNITRANLNKQLLTFE